MLLILDSMTIVIQEFTSIGSFLLGSLRCRFLSDRFRSDNCRFRNDRGLSYSGYFLCRFRNDSRLLLSDDIRLLSDDFRCRLGNNHRSVKV